MEQEQNGAMQNDSGPGDGGSIDQKIAEVNRKWQSRFDQVLKEKKILEAEFAEHKAAKEASQSEREAHLHYLEEQQKVKADLLKYSADKGVNQKLMFDLMGYSDEPLTDIQKVDLVAQTIEDVRLQEADKFARKHGRKVVDTKLNMNPTQYGELMNYTDAELQKMGPVVDRVIDNALKGSKSTLRSRIKEGGYNAR